MEIGAFEERIDNPQLLALCRKISGSTEIINLSRICERYGTSPEDVRKYDVYRIDTAAGQRILKKTSQREIENYNTFLMGTSLPVPRYYGSCTAGDALWMMLEFLPGGDLRDMTDALAAAAAESLAAIQNAYWNHAPGERFTAYRERIEKRYAFIRNTPVLGEAYRLFLERQKDCPRTLSHGDFLQFNSVNHDGKVYAIDWGNGGVMPYSLDIARFIAHGSEDRLPFPFYMTQPQKALFVQRVYQCLDCKPEYRQYLFDIRLAVLNEYVEFMEADEDEDGWYLTHANALAQEILAASN